MSVIILQFFYPIRTHILILIQGSMIQNIRSEERKNARVAENYENQQRLEKIYNRISFLRQSCRCRFICTGLKRTSQVLVRGILTNFYQGSREACEELMSLEDQLQK